MNRFLLLVIATQVFPSFCVAGVKGIYVDGHVGSAQVKLTDIKIRNMSQIVTPPNFDRDLGTEKHHKIAGGLTLGYNFKYHYNLPLRAELNYTIRDRLNENKTSPIDPGYTYLGHNSKLGLQTLMTNLWFDIPTGLPITPYIGGGAGIAYINYKSKQTFTGGEYINSSEYKTNFAWQVGAGINYWVNDHWSFDIGYRYLYAGKVKSDKSIDINGGNTYFSDKAKIKSSEYMLTARYTF